jgi:hypothetical protein
MDNRTPILNELQLIAPTVAQISPYTPYQAPVGYFEGLAGQILQLIRDEQEGISPVLKATDNPYSVPAGYFEGLASQILQRVKAAAREEGPAISDQAKTNPFTVPQGYFEGLAGSVLNRIKAEEAATVQDELAILSPLLNKIDKKSPFSTPAGYFDELTDNALSGARAIEFVNEELENLSPLMSSLKGKQVYSVPAGYFDSLAGQLIDKVQAQQPAKVVSMRFTRKVIRYAVAAVVAGIIVLAVWMYMGNGKTGVAPSDNPIAKDIKEVSDTELQNYLEDQNTVLAGTMAVNTTSPEIKTSDLKDMLADVSDDELQKYLEQFSNTKDILTN